jgi:ribosomal protein S3
LISGRLNGAEMARSEGFKDGRVLYQLSEQILIMH